MGAEVCEESGRQQLTSETDPEVVRRRTELFNKFVAPFYNMIYKLTMNYTNNREHVEENYTEVLVNFYRRIETYDQSRSIHTWLHIVTKRQVAELERRRRKHDNKSYDVDIEDYGDNMLGEEGHVSHTCMGVDNYREMYNDDILAVLDAMRPIHRDAWLLQQAGYSLKEIAEIEHEKGTLKSKNIETVKSRLFFARQYLRNHLTRDGNKREAD